MSSQNPVDFAGIVEQVKQSQVGKESLSIWGGRCTENDLLTFLEGWQNLAQMPYRIWEYASNIVFQKGTLPENAILLQRGRLFGKGGDLEVRRDGQEFAWRFVGPAGTQPPDGDYQAENYWETHPNAVFFEEKTSALLWGARQDGDKRWKDNRVGAAKLDYPDADGWKRVQIDYTTFSQGGRV
ncbi:TIGR03986 family CRISPR-associated RAMP protein, partial [Candidatus Parcubacteria bacterium]